ncbi:hypothetical protein C2E20_7169 [Micractinium conductrix]|uniref:Uncharacterized protein n=1 Tax=Micractinium conductrix TaxID=554055 RepID=A0A2P6V5F8_9CHLO|nr:hypothetical protein C2E20_7169 [Micractinium conductrix]|eukprot:PSC69323.1 hypothetical protein C2E20_7169 [Micractinium conductrix]
MAAVEPAVPPRAAAAAAALRASSAAAGSAADAAVEPAIPVELDDAFTGLACEQGLMTVAGFGSLLSETSARSTFPQLRDFRQGRLRGWRRVFAHQCDIFFARGIAHPETREVSSLSVEEHPESEIVVSLFEVEATPESVAAFIEREHEFRFVTVEPLQPDGSAAIGRRAVVCARWNDEAYRQRRCPPHEWQRRYGTHGFTHIWTDDVLPCRVYLRHCVLAAQRLGFAAYASFLDGTWLSDRRTTVRQYLAANPDIMDELPPASLIGSQSTTVQHPPMIALGAANPPAVASGVRSSATSVAPTMVLPDFARLLASAAAAKTATVDPAEDDRTSPVFVVSEVVNGSGGRTGCFLYRGSLLAPQPRSRTPDHGPWPLAAAGGCLEAAEEQLVPQAGLEDGKQPNWAALEGQQLTLYFSYEQGSPKAKQRAPRTPAAPWRVSLRDADDEMLFCLRGLPQRLRLDAGARLAVWGPSVAVAFPTPEDAHVFAQGVCCVEVQERSLAGTPQAALLAAHAAERRLRCALPPAGMPPSMPLMPRAYLPSMGAAPACPPASPASPDLVGCLPRVGGKRRAEAPLPALLMTPTVKPRFGAPSMITPTCSSDLDA